MHENDNRVTLFLRFVLSCSLCCCWHLWFPLSELFAVVCSVQTSVFIPVLGSSTSVIADSTMTSPVVIATLLDKFKVSFATVQHALVSIVHVVLVVCSFVGNVHVANWTVTWGEITCWQLLHASQNASHQNIAWSCILWIPFSCGKSVKPSFSPVKC